MGNGEDKEGSWINWQGCFACGKENPWGLHLEFRQGEDFVWAEVVFHKNYSGYPGIIHGGIISTVLDEAMAKALLFKGIVAVTVDINVKFRKKASPGERYLVKGWVNGRRRNVYDTESVLLKGNEKIAEAKARFFSVRTLEKWGQG